MTRLNTLKENISAKGSLLVLFSGGLDSTVLAKITLDVLGSAACALTISSPIIPKADLEEAGEAAGLIGIRHVVLEFNELEADAGFAVNPPDRCYRCRKIRNALVLPWAHSHGFAAVADGLNSSDLKDYRPGIRASFEDGIWQPFIELGITKEELRAMAKDLDLPRWDRPGTVCLCSRFPCGFPLREELLRRVEAAEEYVKGLGFLEVRVRCFPYDAALVEVDDPDKAVYHRNPIVGRLRGLGFSFVSLDLEGFVSGKMNRVIPGAHRA